MAGRHVKEFFDVERTTPMHQWHVDNAAKFEDVGQWKRAWYYPKENEDMHQAVNREVKATRNGIGILDASTLGSSMRSASVSPGVGVKSPTVLL